MMHIVVYLRGRQCLLPPKHTVTFGPILSFEGKALEGQLFLEMLATEVQTVDTFALAPSDGVLLHIHDLGLLPF